MDILNPADLKSLITQPGRWSVSLYMPTQRAGNEQQQSPIRAQNNQVILESGPNPGNGDLLDLAAAETILKSGQVFAFPSEQRPGKGDPAAILRYAVPVP
jgi:hypothetical protein